jgi:hypothetical protein
VVDLSWSRCAEGDCLRIHRIPPGAHVEVRPRTSAAVDGLQPTAGRLVRDGEDVCFVPRFGFAAGAEYIVTVDGSRGPPLLRASTPAEPTTFVTEIRPTAPEVPRNLLRLYVSFSAPMATGHAHRHVSLVDGSGLALTDALLPSEEELWDTGRRRLTLLLDPARIKRGLVSHRETGYPLRAGSRVTFAVDAAFPDAHGAPMTGGAERRYQVGGDERRHVDPAAWTLAVPEGGTATALVVRFARPMDHGLLGRCLRVAGPDGCPVDGSAGAGPGELSWQLSPARPWVPGPHQLLVDPILEDLAGNSLIRVFDRDVDSPADDPRPSRPGIVPFLVR